MKLDGSAEMLAMVLKELVRDSEQILLELKKDAEAHGFDVTPYFDRLANLESFDNIKRQMGIFSSLRKTKMDGEEH